MEDYQTRVIINAPASAVFKVLTHAELYSEFDPNCTKVEGKIALGEWIKVYSKLHSKSALKFKVIELLPNKRMVWASGLSLKLFEGRRTFVIMAKDDQTTEFRMDEAFSGPLSSFLMRNSSDDIGSTLNEFSLGLKQYMESRP